VKYVLLFVLAIPCFAQTDASDWGRIGYAAFITSTATDYQCVGINPANLGFVPEEDIYRLATPVSTGITRSKRSWAFTVGESSVSASSDALRRGDLWDALTQKTAANFTTEEKNAAAEAFINNGLRFSADVMAVGASYQSEHLGGMAISVRERAAGTFTFNEAASRLIFEGRHYSYFDSLALDYKGDTVGYAKKPLNFSQLFGGTRLQMIWFRDIGLSYGLKVADVGDVRVYLGASGRYLMGYAYLNAYTQNGELRATSALSPIFGISYGKATTPSFIAGTAFEPVGTGWGLDLGATITIGNAITISGSVVDLGAITWSGNVFTAQDTILNGLTSTGFNSYNLFKEAPKITGQGNFFKWEGLQGSKAALPSRVRIGSSYRYSPIWRFGFDAVFPFNQEAGALGEPVVAAGFDVRPTPWLRISSGFGGGGNAGYFVPISVNFSLFNGIWELGLSSRDIATFVFDKSPVLSVTIGIARIRL